VEDVLGRHATNPRSAPRGLLRKPVLGGDSGESGLASIVKLAIQFPGTEPGACAIGSLIDSGASGTSGRAGRAYSSVGLERTPDKREVGGSNPPRPTTSDFPAWIGAVAQLVERQLCKLDVVGSNPISSTRVFRDLGSRRAARSRSMAREPAAL
jgi:hypothetical protein